MHAKQIFTVFFILFQKEVVLLPRFLTDTIMIIRYFAIIFGCLGLGELIVGLTHIPFPSSIIGMLFLTLFLYLGWIKLQAIKALSDLLISNLGLFFVPPSIGIMAYFKQIGENFLAILISIVISTIVVIVVTGHIYQFFRKKLK
jgi:lrgA family protein